jgi:hypothetical protein
LRRKVFGQLCCFVEQLHAACGLIRACDGRVVSSQQIVPTFDHRERYRQTLERPICALIVVEHAGQHFSQSRRVVTEPCFVKTHAALPDCRCHVGRQFALLEYAAKQLPNFVGALRRFDELFDELPMRDVVWVFLRRFDRSGQCIWWRTSGCSLVIGHVLLSDVFLSRNLA